MGTPAAARPAEENGSSTEPAEHLGMCRGQTGEHQKGLPCGWQRHGITSTSSLVLWSLVAVAYGITSMLRFGLAI